ncbi:hypothetical protein BLOT_013239 [Blomia tropicalis]|nr:hypothetical protein BLOT_013239 [Blomia tropicalis]
MKDDPVAIDLVSPDLSFSHQSSSIFISLLFPIDNPDSLEHVVLKSSRKEIAKGSFPSFVDSSPMFYI